MRQQQKTRERGNPSPLLRDTGASNDPPTPVVETLEHRRFVEFCDACKRYRYIGLCYGSAGVGKTLSARHYSGWDAVEAYWSFRARSPALLKRVSRATTVFYTPRVVASPGHLERDIQGCRRLLLNAAIERVRRLEEARLARLLRRLEELRDKWKNPNGYRGPKAMKAEEAFLEQQGRAMRAANGVPDPTALLVIDEADRLKVAGLEQIRDIFDKGGIGLVLIGMPGIEKRLARYPQLYSRIGFVHEFRPLGASQIRQLLQQHWTPPGVHLPRGPWDPETVAAIIRMTRGNFRLLNRLLTQTARVLEINSLREVTKAAVEAARESLVIGEA